ncbi:hypothetical protein CEXT_455731 [Caerostris extrusa]|uniref:Set2 Rpb1 interacting domain-containing protein n=1 Tax=Caerostris extrusa TaxID=172846 RepID=A0AAV4MTV3_CAEEX|nr:hypothetical protein CEXT_455731 [Caerostris extrusa]
MSAFVVHCLMPYYEANSPIGKITNSDDFKYLARKLTHTVMKLKMNISNEDSERNENKNFKVRDYIHKYMANCGPVYKRE